jgi:hypothetical protein
MDDVVSTGGDSTPVESPSAGESRPSTPDAALDAAFAELSASPEPAAPTPEAPAGEVPTTVEPPTVEDVPGSEGTEGPIPFKSHKTALDNARTKAAQETEQRLLQQLQQELAPLREHILLAQALTSDRAGTLARLIDESKDDPQVTALLARSLAGRRGQKPTEEAEPAPDLQTAEGELVYSAKQLKAWQDWNARKLMGAVDQKYAPLMQSHEQAQKARVAAEKWQQYETTVQSYSAEQSREWDEMPFMEKNPDGTPSPTRAAILKRSHEIATEMTQQLGQGLQIDPMRLPWVALQRAYREIAKSQAIPSLQAKTQSQLIQTAVKKSQGSTVDPVASAPAQPRKPRSVDEALDQAFSGVGV